MEPNKDNFGRTLFYGWVLPGMLGAGAIVLLAPEAVKALYVRIGAAGIQTGDVTTQLLILTALAFAVGFVANMLGHAVDLILGTFRVGGIEAELDRVAGDDDSERWTAEIMAMEDVRLLYVNVSCSFALSLLVALLAPLNKLFVGPWAFWLACLLVLILALALFALARAHAKHMKDRIGVCAQRKATVVSRGARRNRCRDGRE